MRALVDVEAIRANWALWASAAAFALAVTVFAAALWRRTSRGQLRATLKGLELARRQRAVADKAVARAERQLQRLSARADTTKPRVLKSAKDALQDAQALRRIAGDRVMVEVTRVRQVIVEEFPPARHAALRARYLAADDPEQP